MRDIAITAGVNDTLPVIAQGWFCGSSRERIAERFPKRASVVGNPGVAASSELGLAWRDRKPATRDSVQLRFRARGATADRSPIEMVAGDSGGLVRRQSAGDGRRNSRKQMRSGWLAQTALFFASHP